MKNNRTFLEKLLDGAEVKWMPLDEVANIANNARKPVKSSLRISGNIPYYGANNIQDYVEGYTHDGEFVLIAEDGSASLENYSIQWAVGKFWANNHVHVVNGKEKLNNRFLYHYLTNMNFIPFLAGKERAKLTKAKLQQIPIPIPPLPVQTEIVKILDALTALTSELTSELTLRRKQYEYYREKLLSEEELGKVGFEWKCLKNIFNIFAGGDVPKEFYSQHKTQEFNIPILSNGTGNKSLYGWTNKAKINKPSLTISARGTIGWTSYREEPFYPIVRLLVLTPKIELNLKYAYHFMKMIEKNYKVPESGIPQLTKPMIEDLRIPVPSFSEQQSIASILDKFETLTHSITEGLPLAIQQSQKRYEYYRELLLNF